MKIGNSNNRSGSNFLEMDEDTDENENNDNVHLLSSERSKSSKYDCISSIKRKDVIPKVQTFNSNNCSNDGTFAPPKKELFNKSIGEIKETHTHKFPTNYEEMETLWENPNPITLRNKLTSSSMVENCKKVLCTVVSHAKTIFLTNKIKGLFPLQRNFSSLIVKHKLIDKRSTNNHNKKKMSQPNEIYNGRSSRCTINSSNNTNINKKENMSNIRCVNYFLKTKETAHKTKTNKKRDVFEIIKSVFFKHSINNSEKETEGNNFLEDSHVPDISKEEKESDDEIPTEDATEEKIEENMKNELWKKKNKLLAQNRMDKNYNYKNYKLKQCEGYDFSNENIHFEKEHTNCTKDFKKKVETEEDAILVNKDFFEKLYFSSSSASSDKLCLLDASRKFGDKTTYNDMSKSKVFLKNPKNKCVTKKSNEDDSIRKDAKGYTEKGDIPLLANNSSSYETTNDTFYKDVFEKEEMHKTNRNKLVYKSQGSKENGYEDPINYKNTCRSIYKKTYAYDKKTDLLAEELKQLLYPEKSQLERNINSDEEVRRKECKEEETKREKSTERENQKREKRENIATDIKYNVLDKEHATGDHLLIDNAEYNKLKREHASTIRLIENLIMEMSRPTKYKELETEGKEKHPSAPPFVKLKNETIRLDDKKEKSLELDSPPPKNENKEGYITLPYNEESLIEALEKLRISKKKKEIEKNIFYKCKDNQAKVALAILNYADGNKLLLEKFNVRFQYSQIRCLRETQWLNDEVINFYFCMLQEHNTNNSKSTKNTEDMFPKIFTFSTFFFQSLTSNGYNYKNVAKWTKRKKVDIFSFDLILIPLHVRGNHWTLGVVNMKEKNIKLYDSLNLQNKNFFEYIKRYIADEAQDKKKEIIDLSQWTCDQNGDSEKGIPLQQNGYDCGVFTCMFAKCLSFGRDFDFNQDDIRDIRFKMVYDISKGCLQF